MVSIFLISALILWIAGWVYAQVTVDETNYQNGLTTSGYSMFQEDFKGPGWIPVGTTLHKKYLYFCR